MTATLTTSTTSATVGDYKSRVLSLSTAEYQKKEDEKFTKLYDNWTYWAHLPHDTDWTDKSYKEIMTFNTAEAMVALNETIPEDMVKNCMLFLMRKGIKPIWEDPKNRNGGCFSYKVPNKNVYQAWKDLAYHLVGETLTNDRRLERYINGITISPKKSFCIVKIWLTNCLIQKVDKIVDIEGLDKTGVIFKKQTPEY